MKKIAVLSVVFSVAFLGLSACTIYPDKHSVFASIGLVDHFDVRRHRNVVFPMATSFYIPIPTVKVQNPAVDVFVLESSVEVAYRALTSKFPYAVVGMHPEGLEEALGSAGDKRCDYVFYMEFIDVHDAVGVPARPDWPGPGGIDRVHLKVVLAEVKTHKIIDSIYIQSESGWVSFFNDRPVDLLEVPLRNVSRLLSSQWN